MYNLLIFPPIVTGIFHFLVTDNCVVMSMKDLTHCSHEEQYSSGSWIKSCVHSHIISVKVTDASRGTYYRTLANWVTGYIYFPERDLPSKVFSIGSFLISAWLYAEDVKGDVSSFFSQCDRKKTTVKRNWWTVH